MGWIFCRNHTAFGNDTWCGAQNLRSLCASITFALLYSQNTVLIDTFSTPDVPGTAKQDTKRSIWGAGAWQQPPIFRLSKFNHICFSKNLNLFCVSFCQWRSTEKFYEPKLYWCQKAVDFVFFKQKCSCEGFILFFCSCHFIEDNMKKTHNKAWLVIKLHF